MQDSHGVLANAAGRLIFPPSWVKQLDVGSVVAVPYVKTLHHGQNRIE